MEYLASCAAEAAASNVNGNSDNGVVLVNPTLEKQAKRTRGSGFTKTEDLLICKSFIAASEDAVLGTSQKVSLFRVSMHTYYEKCLQEQEQLNQIRYQHYNHNGIESNTVMVYSRRKPDSIYSRFKDHISPRVTKFLGVKKTVLKESGWDDQMHYQAVKLTYEQRYDKLGNPDDFIACVEYLQDKPKWHAFNDANNNTDANHKRPTGQKKVKAMLKDRNIVKETIKEITKLEGMNVGSVDSDESPASDITSVVNTTMTDASAARTKFFSQSTECITAYCGYMKEQQDHRMIMSLPTPERREIQKLRADDVYREELEMKKAELASKRRRLELQSMLEDETKNVGDESDDCLSDNENNNEF